MPAVVLVAENPCWRTIVFAQKMDTFFDFAMGSFLLSRNETIWCGGPGVGKTTLVNTILLILRAKKVRCLLCAPTGRAAKHLSEATGAEAKTIHCLLEVQPAASVFTRNEGRPLETNLLVADETSMVGAAHESLAPRPASQRQPTARGDVDQLPSVGPGMVLRHIIDSGVLPVVRLTEVFRQSKPPSTIPSLLRSFKSIPSSGPWK